MKKVLYVTNIEVPYKVKFFNELAQACDLTVLYERRLSSNRDSTWSKSENAKFHKMYLDGIKVGNENAFSFSIIKIIKDGYDEIIISCINSPVQLFAIAYMKLKGINYVLSFDGELFINNSALKSRIKKFFIKGADKYLIAGEKSAETLNAIVKSNEVYPYYFSSYTDEELKENGECNKDRKKYVLVVGQYFNYKGLDLAVKVARLDSRIKYKFVGMGGRTDLFIKKENISECSNIEVIPFLPKDELNEEYRNAAVLLLPSRQECWGLVVNEAASFGLPIVSTTGSGAAIEYLTDYSNEYIFDPRDEKGILNAITSILKSDNTSYSEYLKEKSKKYSIEAMVSAHVDALKL